MKAGIRRTMKRMAIVTAISLGAVGLLIGPMLVGELRSQGRVDRVFWRELCRGVLMLTQDAVVRGTAASYGRIGDATYPIRAVHADSVVADKAVLDTIALGTTIGGPNGSILMWARNVGGVGIGSKRAMIWGPVVTVVATAVKNEAAQTVADTLKTTGAKYTIAVTAVGTAGATDTLYVRGKDAAGATQIARQKLTAGSPTTPLVVTGTAGKAATKLYWTQVDSVSFAAIDGADSASVVAYPYAGVTVSGSATAGNFAGVSVDSFASNGTGRICIAGTCQLRVNSNTTAITPGGMIETAAWGVGLTDAAATTGQNIARSLEYAKMDSLAIQVIVGMF